MSPLLKAPTWGQRADPLPDGRADPQAAVDCGEECVAMAIAELRGINLSAGCLRESLDGPNRSGVTTATDLSRLLRAFRVPSTAYELTRDQVPDYLVKANTNRHFSIPLGAWVDSRFLHWVLVVGFNAHGAIYNDPWFGNRVSQSWEFMMERYHGPLLVLEESVS